MDTEKTVRLTFDRLEGDLAVCLDEHGRTLTFPARELDSVSEGNDFIACITDSRIEIVDLLSEENAERRARMRRRLRNLFRNT